MMTDPIADLLTRIRNANRAHKEWTEAPWSRLKEHLLKVLVEEGFLKDAVVREDEGRKTLRIYLRYDEHGRSVINGIERVSRPSLRVYVETRKIPQLRGGLGVNVLSTPKGLLADRVARREKLGGEILCSIW